MILVVWTAFCVGASLLSASGSTKGESRSSKTMQSLGFGVVIWTVGIAVWMLAGVVASALN